MVLQLRALDVLVLVYSAKTQVKMRDCVACCGACATMVISMCDDLVDAQRRCLVVADRFTV